jgi:catechol 2,3-dioxygenase-like lactoylglutathione lyase family enzyme
MSTLKTHISLNTPKFEESIEFYKAFFGKDPVKVKPGYAKFNIEEPGLNLALNKSSAIEKGALNHLGIQVQTSDEVWKAKERLQAAGLSSFDERDTTCCYALQDKIWVTDPNGYNWEIFVVKIQDVPVTAGSETCCS